VAVFRFPLPLEDPRWRWITWKKCGFVDFQPPPLGTKVRLGSFIESGNPVPAPSAKGTSTP
jgi:hypothetical protein